MISYLSVCSTLLRNGATDKTTAKDLPTKILTIFHKASVHTFFLSFWGNGKSDYDGLGFLMGCIFVLNLNLNSGKNILTPELLLSHGEYSCINFVPAQCLEAMPQVAAAWRSLTTLDVDWAGAEGVLWLLLSDMEKGRALLFERKIFELFLLILLFVHFDANTLKCLISFSQIVKNLCFQLPSDLHSQN